MNIQELREMPEEELRKLSLQKNKKGNATSDALQAQQILWERSGCCLNNHLCRWKYGSKKFADDPDGNKKRRY